MSRVVDFNAIAGQIIEATQGRGKFNRESIVRQYERLTLGLAEYERAQVAWLVNFRLASPVL